MGVSLSRLCCSCCTGLGFQEPKFTQGQGFISDEDDKQLLRGILKIHVKKAENLPNTDSNVALCCTTQVDVTDPYVNIYLGDTRIGTTNFIDNHLDPVWDENFTVDVCHKTAVLTFDVRDKDIIGTDGIGYVYVMTKELIGGDKVEGVYDLRDKSNESNVQGRLHLSVQYVSKDKLDKMEAGKELPRSYFPAKQGNRVTLYQDADTQPMKQFKGLSNPDGSPYEPTRCWRDVYDSIRNAKKFIYVTGWAIYTEINLVRGLEDEDQESNFGELLKAKAAQDVRVLVLAWNEADIGGGMMGTHDEETLRYFEGTGVHCILAARENEAGMVADQLAQCGYTHHQKTIICDTTNKDGTFSVEAFIGGLDIHSGRYDTPEFPLFKTLQTLHANDFIQKCFPGVTCQTGPREPWHDCHAKVVGPIAYDIKQNFEERWCKQSEGQDLQLYDTKDDGDFNAIDEPATKNKKDGGKWTVQLFRSITSDSAKFKDVEPGVLHSKGSQVIQNDIMRCMVHQIRQAKNFIYMENQYFLGSAYAWRENSEAPSKHIVPQEITQRIIDKIRMGEMFRVYIVIPMWPEGNPASDAIQEILRWQFCTMQSMYQDIGDVIQEVDADTQPTDYLMFFCLGKRESPEDLPDGLEVPEPGSMAETLRTSLRHPVYVHSKMTIIDDDYVLCGSANINQRSMGGNRDTEIAVGCFQPDHLAKLNKNPKGGVHTYRMALWSAHLGGYKKEYTNPKSKECVAAVKKVAGDFWKCYIADEPEHSDVHLLPYPIKVAENGDVSCLDEPWNQFPDTMANVQGEKSGYLPLKMTT